MSLRIPALLCICGAVSLLAAASPRSATILTNASGSRILTVNPDSNSISIVDGIALSKVAEIGVCTTPQTIATSTDENRAFVVCRDGMLSEVDLAGRRVIRSVRVGYDPFGVVVGSGRVYVTVTGDARLSVLDESTLGTIASIPTEPFPRGLTLVGGKLYVTHFRSGKMSVVDPSSLAVTAVIPTLEDSNISQSVVVSGSRAYLPQTRSNAANPALLFDTTVFPIVSVIDLVAGRNLNAERISLDITDRPVSMPLDVALTSTGKMLVVHAGSDDVSVIAFALQKLVAHIAVGSNPRGVALSPDERFAYVNNTLSGTVSVIGLTSNTVVSTVPVTSIPLPAAVLSGKLLFNTSNRSALAKDRWMACASCHFDGGTDGRTWLFRDGPRNTTSLVGVGETLPIHWSGDLDELQDVENTIRVIQAGTGLASGASNCEPSCDRAPPNAGRSMDLDDLVAFMLSLRPAPRPVAYSVAASRGERLFRDPRAGCATCHVPPLYTDRLKHDVGTGKDPAERKGSTFDTPSLQGLYDSAPYFHDGSAATLIDVVRSSSGQHGKASLLTETEKNDLAEFLHEIPFVSPRRRAAGR